MMDAIRLREPLGDRTLTAAQLPASLGGPGAAIVVPGAAAGEVLATLGLREGRAYLERQGEASPLWLLPGTRLALAQATLLALPGEAIELELQHDADNRTAPPDILPPPADAQSDPADVPLSRIAFHPAAAAAAPSAGAGAHRRWLPAAGLALLAAAAVCVFVFGARAIGVRIELDPADAQLSVEGGTFHPSIAGRHWLLPGRYQLRAQRAGFEPLRRELAIADGSPTELRLQMVRTPSPVRIDALPAAAQVFWDERAAPGNPTVLPAGRHRLRILAPRYAPYEGSVQVMGGGDVEVVKPALVAQWARVRVLSEPAGAQVQVDGAARGVTPLDLELDAGLRAIILSSPAAKEWHGSVLVHGGEQQTVGPVRLAAPDARLSVASVPAGADVSVGGQYRGRTPLTVSLPPGLEYELAVQRAGYEPATRRVDLRSTPAARVEVRLAAVMGEVSVQGEPADARVFADGRELGAAGQVFRLPAAPTAIEVRKAGFDAFRTTLTPKAGYPQAVNFTLAAAGTSGQAVLPKMLRNSLGMELRLMPLGDYEMGSNRREPGRRSNEVQRRVSLKRPFYIAATETTNLQFRRFRESHASGVYRSKTLDLDTQPVVNLTWNEAVDFCNWLSAQEKLAPAYVKEGDGWKLASPATNGYRLPTEAEWEFVARHDGTGPTLRYPWGASLPVAPGSGNYADASARFTLDTTLPDYNDGYAVSVAPGKFPANALGLSDLGGNVSEWVNDWYSSAPPDSDAVSVDPVGPASGKEHVIRGSSFRSATITELRVAWRDGALDPRADLGFRVARYANP